jgi:branched-subunit amino acid aminotransferase/4-amino-4-deoxychorismate lyase
VLYCHAGEVLELTRNNMFFFMGDTLVTPKDNILLGVTRGVVLDLCRGVFAIEERAVRTAEIAQASEAFLTGTTKGVMPVVRIDDTVIGDGTVGPNTRRVMTLFQEHTRHHS